MPRYRSSGSDPDNRKQKTAILFERSASYQQAVGPDIRAHRLQSLRYAGVKTSYNSFSPLHRCGI
ncbi:protein of unknown function [Paraburkholderia dioscoreae]|uniref:Uncharacterized protein n=1 Tax=Paraburkholderia dioscoreae TaxID=2604047 RepID=A0A5Q4ZHF6_9BURK|nr:protein of unknown function [Paraburkholderia dioscoreae]